MIRGPLTIWFCIAFTAAAQQSDVHAPRKATVTAAHTIFLTEIGMVQGHEDTCGRMLRATLESTKRFTVLPDTRGADLVLLYDSVFAAGGPLAQGPELGLTLRDGKTFAELGVLQVPWTVCPTITKDQEAVRQLLNELFELGTSGPVPPFAVAPVSANSLNEAPGAKVSLLKSLFIAPPISPDMKGELSAGHSVLVVDDGLPDDFPDGYANLAQAFLERLGTSTGLHFVNSLADADVVLIVEGTERTPDGWSIGDPGRPWIEAGMYDAKTLMPIADVHVFTRSGKTKKGKPSPAEQSMDELASKFRKRTAELVKDAAKP